MKKYYILTYDKRKEYYKNYYLLNIERINKRNKNYHLLNRKKINENNKEYYAEYYKRNKERNKKRDLIKLDKLNKEIYEIQKECQKILNEIFKICSAKDKYKDKNKKKREWKDTSSAIIEIPFITIRSGRLERI